MAGHDKGCRGTKIPASNIFIFVHFVYSFRLWLHHLRLRSLWLRFSSWRCLLLRVTSSCSSMASSVSSAFASAAFQLLALPAALRGVLRLWLLGFACICSGGVSASGVACCTASRPSTLASRFRLLRRRFSFWHFLLHHVASTSPSARSSFSCTALCVNRSTWSCFLLSLAPCFGWFPHAHISLLCAYVSAVSCFPCCPFLSHTNLKKKKHRKASSPDVLWECSNLGQPL